MNINIQIVAQTARELDKILSVLKAHAGDDQTATILKRLEVLAMGMKEQPETANATLDTVSASVSKVATESAAAATEIKRLNDLIAAGGVITPELQALAQTAVDKTQAIATALKAVDDIFPDAP